MREPGGGEGRVNPTLVSTRLKMEVVLQELGLTLNFSLHKTRNGEEVDVPSEEACMEIEPPSSEKVTKGWMDDQGSMASKSEGGSQANARHLKSFKDVVVGTSMDLPERITHVDLSEGDQNISDV